MDLDLKAFVLRIRQVPTEELLDRVTVYREGMEPVALDLMEGELSQRGLNQEAIAAHQVEREKQGLLREQGVALPCGLCDRPAIGRAWLWRRSRTRLFIFPWRMRVCRTHHPNPPPLTE